MSEAPTAGLDRSPEETFRAARRALRAERRKLVDEQQAFERFADRVAALEPDRTRDQPRLVVDRVRDGGVERVREAYTETVASVPHYREEYGEPPIRHMARECNEELAAAVACGSGLSPQLQRSLAGTAREAASARDVVLDVLDEEAAALDRGAERVHDLVDELVALRDQPLERAEFDSLRETRERLEALDDRCEALTAARQETLRSHSRTDPLDVEDVGVYCYADCESIHPLLSQFAAVAEQVEATRRVVDRRLIEAR